MNTNLFKPHPYANTLLQLLLPIAIYLGLGSKLLIVSVVLFLIYSIIINNIILHRYFTHRHFKVSPLVEKFFLFLTVFSGLGSPFSYAAVHITHHIHSDTDKDPHGPKAGIRSILFLFHRYESVEETIKDNKYCHLLYEKYKFIQTYYLLLLAVLAATLYLINYNLFLFGWLIPVCLLQWGVAVGVYLQHVGGKINNFYYSLFGLGDELHRHHHLDPKLINHALTKYQIDFTYQISRLFSK